MKKRFDLMKAVIIVLSIIAVVGFVMVACKVAQNPNPTPPSQFQQDDGWDAEDCYNREADCPFLPAKPGTKTDTKKPTPTKRRN